MSPEMEITRLQGQIDGALATLQWGMSLLGGLLTICLGLVAYTFRKLAGGVDEVRKRTHRLGEEMSAAKGRVIALETWREEHSKAG